MRLAENLSVIRSRIETACARVGRDPSSVTLIAVTKGQPPHVIHEAEAIGLNLFGENKVQEAKIKKSACSGKSHWHMLGHLQSNKCRDAVYLFEMIHSVDSLSLAQEINRMCEKSGKTMPILLEVNVAGESSKFGFKPKDVVSQLLEINKLPKLEIHGLMTIAPWCQETERVRPFFRQLRESKYECEVALGAPLPELSMGMSGDFEIAIEEGATYVRIGTSLFGPRSKTTPNPSVD